MNIETLGYEAGEVCNRKGCAGIIGETHMPDGECSCHLYPPCGVVADPDEGYCDSSTCVAACFEDHDPDQARGYYRHHATAALSAIGEVEHG